MANTTKPIDSTAELMKIDGELIRAEPEVKKSRAKPYAYDELYIAEYVKNPHLGKTHAYKIATGNTTSYQKQRAFETHQRLASEIDVRLKERVLGCIGFGMDTLFELASNSSSDNVRAACASKLIELGLKVSPPDIKNSESRSREQIISEIQKTRQRLTDMGVKI